MRPDIPTGGANAQREPPQQSGREAELCARCHAHRAQISDAYVHG